MYLQMSSKTIRHDVKIDKIGIYVVVKISYFIKNNTLYGWSAT
jgi:hypothetical protein